MSACISQNADGVTYLHIAACNGYTGVVTFLAQQSGIDLNAQDSAGNTPLHLASFFLQYETAMALLQAGARIDVRNKCAQKPIVITEDTTMIRLLEVFQKHLDLNPLNPAPRPHTGTIGRSSRDKSHAAARLSVRGEGKGLLAPPSAED
jgi:hypothetical protein